MDTVLGLMAVFVLVAINGFFVAAEFAFVGARRTRIAQLADEGHGGARVAQHAIQNLDNYIAATQLGITLASLGLGWIGEPAVAHLFEAPFEWLLEQTGGGETLLHTLSFGVSFSLVTMLHIVFGELAPKALALQRPEGTSVVVARPTTWFMLLFRPVIMVMNSVGNAVVRLLGFEPASGHEQVHSAEELAMLVHSSREAGLLAANEEQLLRNVFDFTDIQMREVMQPRVEVDAIACDTPLAEVLKVIAALHHSRYPVYEDSLDHVIGVLYTKDLLDTIIANPKLATGDGDCFDLRSILREPLFIPMMARADEVLERMKQTKTHVAIIVDEHGGMAGLATMEDVIEELVGDVLDEFDESIVIPRQTPWDGEIIDGLTGMHTIEERFGKIRGEVQSATIGGYVAEHLERIPRLNDRVPYGAYDVYVHTMDEMRVAEVRFVSRGKPVSVEQEAETTP